MKTGAEIFVDSLIEQGVEVIFGLPGAKIDGLFNALLDSPIKLILCRHEQNAAFMAQAYGKLTRKPGVVLVTSGPGVSNLVTGLLTATTEGDPVVAIGGNVPRSMKYKKSHQSSNNVSITEGATKSSLEIVDVNTIPEICANAFKEAIAPRAGAVFISVPKDILFEKTNAKIIKKQMEVCLGSAPSDFIDLACKKIASSKSVALLLGMEASSQNNTKAIQDLLNHISIPVTCTYQGAGVISRELQELFAGRVGLFKNQPADKLLDESETILAIGFSTVEYDPEVWNKGNESKLLIHIDYIPAEIHTEYNPQIELIGDISKTINQITDGLKKLIKKDKFHVSSNYHEELEKVINQGAREHNLPMHPLRFIHDLRKVLDDSSIVACDVGSNYMWMARYFLSFAPRHFLISNGQQTLGVALPWAMAAKLIYPNKKVFSISGDGGFLFSSQELETAVRENIPIIHFVWVDGYYDMVKEQQLMKYKRDCMVKLGYVDIVKYAESFGACGFRVEKAEEFIPILNKALQVKKPCLVEIKIDYSHNMSLFESASKEGD